MEFAHHPPGPLMPMVKLIASQSGCEVVMPQNLVGATLGLPINSSQRTRFGLTKLVLYFYNFGT